MTTLFTLILVNLASPMAVLAADHAVKKAEAIVPPLWMCIPFAGLLLCIAVMPLIKPAWWEKHQPWAVILWSVLFVIPYAVVYGMGTAAETVLECIIGDYLTFIVIVENQSFCLLGHHLNTILEGEVNMLIHSVINSINGKMITIITSKYFGVSR